MRTLKFIVNKQLIEKDPNCDFEGLVPGSAGYLQAEFSFSDEWKDLVKGVGFYSVLGKEYPPQILKDGRTCVIPEEALKKRYFGVKVHGLKDEELLVTNKVFVKLSGRR